MAGRSSSFFISPTTEFESLDFQDNTRQKLWDLTKTISNLQIKLEAEKKRNSHLEENYTKLPANLESLKEIQAELEVYKSNGLQLENKLKESQATAAKCRKDLEEFRDYAFREIRDKELFIISQSSSNRSLQNELNSFKDQCQKVCEEFENRVKSLKVYKAKYKKTKIELGEVKAKVSMNKLDSEHLNLKLELEITQRKVQELLRSREELAKKCNELEMKNQHLNSVKSDFKATLHRRDRTLAEMEYDFKNTLEGIESTKSEETSELLEKITSLEKQIKEMKKNHEEALNLKEDEKAKEKFKAEETKRMIDKITKDKQRSDLELAACKALLDESDNQVIEVRLVLENKIETIRREHKDKVLALKNQIDDLVQKNKELAEMGETTGVSVLGGDSLADELGKLNSDSKDSRMISGFFKESIFRSPAEMDKNLEKLKKTKEKKKKLKKELISKNENLNELERNLKKSETVIRNLNSDITGFNQMIADLKATIKQLESSVLTNENEISKLKTISSELSISNKDTKEKFFALENEISRQKNSFEERVMALKKKYNDKILKYKEDILDLTQNSAKLRDTLTTSKTISAAQASELESSKNLLKKITKSKEKIAELEKSLKSKSELINKLQNKLSELYRIPNVDSNLEENSRLGVIDERVEAENETFECLEKENKGLKEKILKLEDRVQGLMKVVRTEKEVQVVSVESEKGDVREGMGYEGGFGVREGERRMSVHEGEKLELIKEKIRDLAKEMNFSIESVKSSVILGERQEESKDRETNKDSLESDSDSDEQQNSIIISKPTLSSATQIFIFSTSPPSSEAQSLELQLFSLQQDLSIKSERFLKSEHEYQARITQLQTQLKKLEDERQQFTYVTNTEIDEYPESDEEKSILSSRIAVSIIDDFEQPTEGSVLENEDYRNPFDAINESMLLIKSSEQDNTKIAELELEIAEKSNCIRKLHEQVKDVEGLLEETRGRFKELSEKQKKMEEQMKIEKSAKTQGNFKPIHDCVLYEAKMTLLEAHNQRLETELIVSKTNWGEMTNTLIRDINEMEFKIKQAWDDYRSLSMEKEELVKRLNEKVNKKSKWNIFARRKRNSDIN